MKSKTRLMAAFLAIMMLFSLVAPISVTAGEVVTAGASKSMNVVPLSSTTSKYPDPLAAIESYVSAFFYLDEREGYGRLRNQLDNGFWTDAEILEVFIDAYEVLGYEKYLQVAELFYQGIIDRRTEDWSWNEFNDDVFWMSLATIRLYKHTQNEDHLRVAKANFDMCFARAWDTTFLDGGCWWKTNNHEKNGCVNGPGALAALQIYEATQDTKYLDIGKMIMDWEVENLFNKNTGEHYDNINIDGVKNTWTNTGNQGNIIGPCTMLYKFTGEQKYFDYAKKAADHAATLGEGGLEILNEGANSGDTIGGKGLLARWLGYFIRECGVDINDYDKFMFDNARAAWNRRNSEGLMWGEFGKTTIENIQTTDETMANSQLLKRDYAAWGCSAAVSWLLNTPYLFELRAQEQAAADQAATTQAPTTQVTTDASADDGEKGMSSVVVIAIVAVGVVVVAAVVIVVVVSANKKKNQKSDSSQN